MVVLYRLYKSPGVFNRHCGQDAVPQVNNIAVLAESTDHFVDHAADGFRGGQQPGRVKIVLHPPLDSRKTNEKGKDIQRMAQQMNDLVESMIRLHPDQWLWMHDRWKSFDRRAGKSGRAVERAVRRTDVPWD